MDVLMDNPSILVFWCFSIWDSNVEYGARFNLVRFLFVDTIFQVSVHLVQELSEKLLFFTFKFNRIKKS